METLVYDYLILTMIMRFQMMMSVIQLIHVLSCARTLRAALLVLVRTDTE